MLNRDKFYFRVFCTVFWVVSCVGFTTQEILPFLDMVYRPVMMLGDLILVWLGLLTLRNRKDIVLILVFCGLVFISNIILNRLSLLVTVNGIRDFVPIIFSLPIVRYLLASPYADDFRQSFNRQLYIFLILQAICVTEQFFRYGAGDHGGGTMGNLSSGLVSISICLTSFYLSTRDWDSDNYLKSLWRNRVYIILLYPVFLNETKVSFFLLAIYFALLYRFNIKSVGKVMLALPFMAIIAVGLFFAYLAATGQDTDVGSSDFIDVYLTGGANAEDIVELAHNADDYDLFDEEWGFEDLPRFLKMGFLFPTLMVDTAGGVTFGAGAGHFKGGTFIEPTQLAQEYHWLIGGTIPLSFFIIFSLGISGLIWFIIWIIHALTFNNADGPFGLKMKIFIGLVILILLFYNDAVRYYPLPMILYYLSLVSNMQPLGKSGHSTLTDKSITAKK